MQGKAGTGRGGKYQGKPCKKGHSGIRYKAGGGCVQCMNEQSSHQWKTDPAYRERRRVSARKIYPTTLRNRNLLRDYGITIDQYNVMNADQAFCCLICGEADPQGLRVDHCHKTGLVRGLLYTTCNLGLGGFKDSEDRLLNAIAYLKRSRL
jgi:recombination endonuclease VII